MLAWIGVVFGMLLLAGCLVDALFGATAAALAEPAPIETLDGLWRSEAANDEPQTAWSTDVRSTLASAPQVEIEVGQRVAA